MVVRVTASLRIELFPADLDVSVDFYVSMLAFAIARDDRPSGGRYVCLRRDDVVLGLAERSAASDESAPGRVDVEIVLEVDDVTVERDRVLADGGTLADDVTTRPWGLTDFRLYDPDGNYWRVTGR
jgi:predicted enzyme related to lactoylglutathione lyase